LVGRTLEILKRKVYQSKISLDIGIMKWVWHVAHMGKMRNEYTVLVRKIEVKTPLERPFV
jgi:hypothetical protein